MNKEDKLILGTLAGVDLVLSPEHYEEYKGTLNKQLEEKNKEIDRLNNIIKELSKDVDMWNKKYNEQFNIITELEKWLEERTYGMNEIHTYKIGALEDEVILNKLKELKENNNE